LADAAGDAIVLSGDTPFIRAETLQAILEARTSHAVVVLGFHAANPGRYGRLLTQGNDLLAIREFKDATDEERNITLCNSGVICADAKTLFSLVAKVGNSNAGGEYYLTDIVELARAEGLSAGVVICDEAETMASTPEPSLPPPRPPFRPAPAPRRWTMVSP
jgi:bifunctional UDP-N-acetylglucosamine pyrophosphorylase/glucosamine-1-phosphate N-acetyltransferase